MLEGGSCGIITVMDTKKDMQSNIWKLYLISFFGGVMFFIPILVPFLMDFGFSMHQIFLAEATFAITLVILEVPSGYFADRYGRKISIVLGALLHIFGFALYAGFQNFWQFVLANIIIGMGVAFISGADSALIYESLEQINQKKRYKKVQGNNFAISRLASVASTLIGAWLFTLAPRLPFYLSVVPFIFIFFVTLTLHETKVHHEIHEGWGHFREIIKDSLFSNKKLRNFLLFTSIGAFFTIGFFMNEAYMSFIELPLIYFGVVIALMNIASGLAAKYAENIENYIGKPMSLMAMVFLPAIAWMGMALFNSFWVLPLLILSSLLWGFSSPIFSEFIHEMTTKDRRATVISISGLLTRLVFTLVAPLIGYITDVFSVQEALLLGAVILVVSGSISILSLKKVKVI